ncbi:MAG: ABC transporter substrate-binding protein [Chloroflexota bacterium]|nr:ABC transporter substrate-binding protein [Chloroflexota bacterium]
MISKPSLKTVNLVLVLVMLAALLAACGGTAPAAPAAMPTATRATELVAPELATPEPEEEAAAGEIVEGGQVNIAMWSPPNSFNPLNSDSNYGLLVIDILFDSLTKFNDNVEFAPRLADSWEINEDNTEFTFHLNPDAMWHDGTPVTAADVEFTMWAISHPEIVTNRGANISFLKGLEGSKRPEGVETVEGVEVIDDYTIKFTAKNPIDPLALLEQLGNQVWIIPKHIAQEMSPAEFDTQDFWLNPTVASGPFKFVRYETDQFIELERNDDYYGGKPHLDKIIVSIVTPATMVAQLEKGEVDIAAAGGIGDIPLDDWERVQALPNVTAASYQDNGYQYAVINMRPDSIWGDKRLRQALAYGINRQLIVDSLLKGEGVVAQGPIVPVTYYYNTEVEGLFSYDPEKAKELLAEAGWDPDYEMTIIVPIGNVVRELSADIIQANLAEIGIKSSIEKMDFPTLIQRAMDGDYDLALMGWGGLLDPDVRSQFQTGGQYNDGMISIPELDELLEEGANTADTEARKAIYDEFQMVFIDEMPIIPLYWPLRLAAINNRVQNASHIITTNGLLRNIEDWWVTDGQ